MYKKADMVTTHNRSENLKDQSGEDVHLIDFNGLFDRSCLCHIFFYIYIFGLSRHMVPLWPLASHVDGEILCRKSNIM